MWKEYFYQNKSERLGLMLLLLLILVITGTSWGLGFLKETENLDASTFQQEVEAFEADIALKEQEALAARKKSYGKSSYAKSKNYKKSKPKRGTENEEVAIAEVRYFDFNPNEATKDEFRSLGLSARTAQSILNYRAKGGQFRIKSDLAKIYTLDQKDYDRLKAFIQLPDSLQNNRRRPNLSKDPAKFKAKKPQIIDLNNATIEDLQKLRGIGPAFAKRIVKYRKALGGFVDMDQLGEVYGLPDSTFQSIRPLLQCKGEIQKINLNTATAEELKSHPYLRWKHANAIVRYRQDQGPYTDPEILRTFFEFDDGYGTYWKIKPYLTL